ncbi:hypothetical protein [Thauera sp. WB-2]|uniref:hypothetical protein n=1 Tax=Thauera sp. WB-2 TaxID=2897772 RepID=UPI0022DE240F|nr:hypothetical protein [Thauera sp. WB-2]WBL62995.1 hypothetical protein LQF09_12985 [Thauera sp. WB-2]
MYLLDTNIISELRKGGRANPGVTAFFATLAAEDIYLSVLTIGEIRRGLAACRTTPCKMPHRPRILRA